MEVVVYKRVMMKVNVLIFGPLKDITGTNTCEVTDVRDTDEMLHKLNRLYPDLEHRKFLIAVQKEIVQQTDDKCHGHRGDSEWPEQMEPEVTATIELYE